MRKVFCADTESDSSAATIAFNGKKLLWRNKVMFGGVALPGALLGHRVDESPKQG